MPQSAPRSRIHRRAPRLSLSGLALVLAVAGVLLVPSTANATPPTTLTPNGTSQAGIPGIPVFSWSRVAGAAKYRVQASTTESFSSTLFSKDTVSSQYVPESQLPVGQIYWRVQVIGESEWSPTAGFVRDAVPIPTQLSPLNKADLPQPKSPPILSWVPVPGATTYSVEISTDSLFTDQTKLKKYTTKSSSFIVPDLQVPDIYYWHVKANLGAGASSDWSTEDGSYKIGGLSLVELADTATNSFSPTVQDVDLDWKPVLGAATYDLQVSTDQNFLNSSALVEDVAGITSTRYARPRTLNNNQYYWRVRPVDAAGNRREWTTASVWKFKRDWPDQVKLEYPANNAIVTSDTFYYQWTPPAPVQGQSTPSPLASSYVLQVSSDATFANVIECSTVHTTYVPGSSGDCWPGAGGTYYWRVLSLDGFTSLSQVPQSVLLSAQINQFTFNPPQVTLTSPANNETVSVPTLRWAPLAGASKYKITITGSGATVTKTITGTTYTPESALPLGAKIDGTSPEQHQPATYTWQVQPVSEDGRVGQGVLLPGDRRKFTLVDQSTPTGSVPNPTAGASPQSDYRFPGLAWSPVVGADSYTLFVGKGNSFVDIGDFDYPAGQDITTNYLEPGSYSWFVQASSKGVAGAIGSQGQFTIRPLDPVTPTSQFAALTGTSLTGDNATSVDHCDGEDADSCQNLRQTPVLTWPENPDTGSYIVTLSNDENLTNLVQLGGLENPVRVTGNMYIPSRALPDSQAGSAYYWSVRPCSSAVRCSAPIAATHSFNKLSRPVTLKTPAADSTAANDVTFTWEDYAETETKPNPNPPGTLPGQEPNSNAGDADLLTPLTTPARTEARTYRIQVSDDPNFTNAGTFLETNEVDQRRFTAYTTTYPEGPLYWRVQAVDGSANPLTWSQSRTFQKVSPKPTALVPGGGAQVPGDNPLSWEPNAFAKTYDIQIYKNNDLVGQASNLVVSDSTQQSTYSLAKPLPFSSEPYTWRVRRGDTKARKGAWSDWSTFRVRERTPTPLLPGVGAEVSPVDSLFSWTALDDASAYRFERRNPAGAVIETVTTAALSWAPTVALPNGGGSWRVSGVDNDGKLMRVPDSWRTFTATTTIAAATPVTISGLGKVGNVLSASAPTWNIQSQGKSVATTYQWYRGTSKISGATGAIYTLIAADFGKEVYVVATGTSPGYDDGTSTSNKVTPGPGTAVSPTTGPSISGNGIVRGVLTANPGAWPGSPTFAYQWLRDDVAISGATKASYTVVAADAAHLITVRVTATATGYDPGTAASGAVKIAKVSSTTTVSLSAKKISKKARAKLTVRIVATGVVDPGGPVVIYDGAKKIGSADVKPGAAGQVVVRLKKLKPGKHKLKAVYAGSTGVDGSSSGTTKLVVTAGRKK